MIRLLTIAVVVSVCLVAYGSFNPPTRSLQEDTIEIPSDDENTVARRDFMRTKLLYAQNVFAGLTTGDIPAIEEAVTEVQRITQGEQWVQIDNDHYRKLTEDFNTTTKRLADAVKSKNIDAIAFRYYQMSTSCIDCHKHIRKAQYEY